MADNKKPKESIELDFVFDKTTKEFVRIASENRFESRRGGDGWTNKIYLPLADVKAAFGNQFPTALTVTVTAKKGGTAAA